MISPKHLSPGKRSAAAAAHDVAKYCAHGRDAEGTAGYYPAGQSAPSRWHGAGAAALGLQGSVGHEQFIEVLQGHLPDGTDLSQRGGRADSRRMGTDLTWSAPKSFSMLATAGLDPRLDEIWREAEQVVAGVIEREMIYSRLGSGGEEGREYTGCAVIASFRHDDTRTVDGRADPDRHTHFIIINATHRADGTWAAMKLDFGERARIAKTADFAGKAHLARRLQELGYQIRRVEHGFEIEGISREQIEAFSNRKAQIDEALGERGLSRDESSGAQRSAANLATRGAKATLLKPDQQWRWRSEYREQGLDVDGLIHAARDREAAGLAPVQDLSTESVRSSVRLLGERQTVMGRNAIRLESLKLGMGNADLTGVDFAITAQAAGLIDVGNAMYTTRAALHREQEILVRARAGRGQVEPLMTPDQARDCLSRRERTQGYRYSAGQRQALELALTSSDQVIGVVGAAGAGKTTSTRGAVSAARDAGCEIIGIAPSARARDELELAGAEVNRTIASFLQRDCERNDHRLVILDEAGMVSAGDMDALMQKLEREGGRLLLIGDSRQLRAVEAGTPFALLIESGAIDHARIDVIQRQADPALRAIAQSFARGDATDATRRAMDYTTTAPMAATDPGKPTTQERREAIARATAAAYLDLSPDERTRTLVLSGTNEVRRQTNSMIRAGLQERGEVSRDGIAIQALDKANFQDESATLAERYKPGMVVRFEESRGRRRRTVEYSVDGVDRNRVQLRAADGTPRRWNPAGDRAAGVYQPREMQLASGDQIFFRENQGEDRIVNGQTATVFGIEHSKDGNMMISARLDDGRTIMLDPRRNHTLDYGWCRTIHSAQGATMDRVIVAGEASRVATAESAYVACSRERHSLHIVTDDPERLQKFWAKWADRQHAIDDARITNLPDLDQLKQLRKEAAQELGREGDLARAREQTAASPPGRQQEREQDWRLER